MRSGVRFLLVREMLQNNISHWRVEFVVVFEAIFIVVSNIIPSSDSFSVYKKFNFKPGCFSYC
jgi:hypothetical protein